LERKLVEFRVYYNEARVHTSLDDLTPLTFAHNERTTCANPGRVRWFSYCRDLVHLPVAA
jgi:hypothetical protein